MEQNLKDSTDVNRLFEELDCVLRRYGIKHRDEPLASASGSAGNRVRDVALEILNGNIDLETLQGLQPEQLAELPRSMRELMALRHSRRLRELQEVNPYFTIPGSRLIRDTPRDDQPSS